MNPVILFVLFNANLLTLVITLSVLMLAFWQQSSDALGRAVVQFLAALSFYNLSVLFLSVDTIMGYSPAASFVVTNLTVTAFGLCVVSSFSLVITLAGMMKQAWQVIARAGVVAVLLLQWPVWTGGFFQGTVNYQAMTRYTSVGIVGALLALMFIILTFAASWAYRRRIGHPEILAGLLLLLGAQALTLFDPVLREVGFPSLISVIASAVLGYNLMRMRLFGPLMLQNAEIGALQEISRILTSSDDKVRLLNTVVKQARHILKTDLALILTPVDEASLVICTQDGATVDLIGRSEPVGDGLNGRVFETQQAMRLPNYMTWDGRLHTLDDVPLHASLSVPLVHNYNVVGVLSVHELESGRLFTDQDQEVLELLAPQAAVAFVNADLQQRIHALQQYNK